VSVFKSSVRDVLEISPQVITIVWHIVALCMANNASIVYCPQKPSTL